MGKFIATHLMTAGVCILVAMGLNHFNNPQAPNKAMESCPEFQSLKELQEQKRTERELSMLALMTVQQKKLLPLVEQGMKVKLMTLTAYDAWSEGSINVPEFRTGRTSIGRLAIPGRTIAVDPKVIPYGSKVYIPSLGWRIAEDTGGGIQGNRIDVLMHTEEQAMQFGRRSDYVLWRSGK